MTERTDHHPQTAEYLDHLETKRKLAEAQERIKALEAAIDGLIAKWKRRHNSLYQSGTRLESDDCEELATLRFCEAARIEDCAKDLTKLTGKNWRRE